MKNRMEEYQNMVGELNQPQKELAGSVERARKRARRTRLLHRITAPIGSMAATAACFVLMVNLFPSFALACSGVPIVRELAAAAPPACPPPWPMTMCSISANLRLWMG